MASTPGKDWDYVIVGSGAGGGTLAARLVESGMRVFLLEAGCDARDSRAARLPDDYDVPAFHAHACENPAMSWNFHVRHYGDEARQRRDWKYQADRQGVLYPRAATLGGCTAHNAMIFMLPHDSDWNTIATATGDPSWRAANMRRYAKRVEACGHRPLWRALRRIGLNMTGHGFDGWLHTQRAMPTEALADDALLKTVVGTARSFVSTLPFPVARALRWVLRGRGDPNARQWRRKSFEGLCYTPLSTRRGRRTGARERLLDVVAKHPDRLHIEFDALASRVLFDANDNAVGVEYLKGKHLYGSDDASSSEPTQPRRIHARREVVLCGGAFNTPQLLMLSGIGPAEELRAHDIPVRVDLPGVGRNLQDRYEVALTYRMPRSWQVLAGTRFEHGDGAWRHWNESGSGLYGSNGNLMGIVRRSASATSEPDVFCMAMLARFEGYYGGFSKLIGAHHDYLTWVVLKAHTQNRAGTVTLRSKDPRAMPIVNFRYFEEGSDKTGEDLRAVVDGMKFVRRMAAPLVAQGVISAEEKPGSSLNTDDELADYVRDTAWGHHASCTCAMGPREQQGVLDGNFKVHGVRRLRAVDASIFPRIPGFFIVSAVYMAAEKAADALMRDVRNDIITRQGDRDGLHARKTHDDVATGARRSLQGESAR
jgi:choline dehydrogenase